MNKISESFQRALEYHQAGRSEQAEALCRQIIQQQPDQVMALHLLAGLLHQRGNLAEAEVYYRQTIAFEPSRAEAYNDLGTLLRQQGQAEAAIAAYEQSITLKPDFPEPHYNLGNGFLESDQVELAVAQYERAIALRPSYINAYCNLACALERQGRVDAAIARYAQAITLDPNLPEVFFNLGNLYRQQRQVQQAIGSYRRAIGLRPNYVEARLNLAHLLLQQGEIEAGLLEHRQALALQPSNPLAYYQMANLLVGYGQLEEAMVHYRHALTLKPDFPEAWLQLGQLLRQQQQWERAIACLQEAVSVRPDFLEAYYALGSLYARQSQIEEATHAFQTALTLDPQFAPAYWASQLLLPLIYESEVQIQSTRQRLTQRLNHLTQQISLDTGEGRQFALAGLSCVTLFYLTYQGQNDHDLLQKYGRFLVQAMAAQHPQWSQPLGERALQAENKIRIGYLSAFFQEHEATRWLLNWLENADRSRFELYGYHIGAELDATTQAFVNASDRFYHLPIPLEPICQQIRRDQLQVLIFPAVGIDPLTTQIAGLRLAPVQCAGWGHPVTSGLTTIDYYFSPLETDLELQSQYTETLVPLGGSMLRLPKAPAVQSSKTRQDFQLRSEAVLYFCHQSLSKYLHSDDLLWLRIVQQVPQAQFLFLGDTPATNAKFQQRLQQTFASFHLNVADYCIVVPTPTLADIWQIYRLVDVVLEPLVWSGGIATERSLSSGLVPVTCPGSLMRSRLAASLLTQLHLTDTIAHNQDDYVAIACRLGIDFDWRQQLTQKLQTAQQQVQGGVDLQALESFFSQVVQGR